MKTSIDNIQDLYNQLFLFEKENETCCPKYLLYKRYQKHVPEHSTFATNCWSREEWVKFESMPKKYRDLINYFNDTSNETIDDALEFCWNMWQEDISKIEKVIDKILDLEEQANIALGIPDVFSTLDPKYSLIAALMEERLKIKQKKKEQEEKELKELRKTNKPQAKSKQYYNVSFYNLNGIKPSEIISAKELASQGMRPHEITALLKSKKPEPAQWNITTKNVEVEIVDEDKIPPAKLSPRNTKRGSNFRDPKNKLIGMEIYK